MKGYFGFELLHQDLCTGEHHRHDKRVLYCRSESQRDKWVSSLQHAAHVVPIEVRTVPTFPTLQSNRKQEKLPILDFSLLSLHSFVRRMTMLSERSWVGADFP